MDFLYLKKINNKFSRIIVVLLALFLGLTSCTKDTDKSLDGTEDGNGVKPSTYLTLNVIGVEENNVTSVDGEGKMAMANPAVLLEEIEMQHLGQFDVRATVSGVSPLKTEIKRQGIVGSEEIVAASNASTSKMEAGVKYRLVIRKKSNGEIVYSGQHTVGEAKEVAIDAGEEYDWGVFSINNKVYVPGFDENTGKLAGAEIANQDLLYSSGELAAQYGENYLNITFERKTVKYTVEINTRGLFGGIESSSEFSLGKIGSNGYEGILKTGDLDIFTGTFSNLQNHNVVASDFLNVGSYGNAVRKGTFYSVSPASVSKDAFVIRLAKLNLRMADDESERNFLPANATAKNVPFESKIGYQYDAKIQLVESAIKVRNIYWARTNLTYRPENVDRYILRADNNAGSEKNVDYWNWMSSTPTGNSIGQDPCAMVYPEGTWRMPTAAEGQSLGAVKVKNKHEKYGFLWGATYSSGYDLDPGQNINLSYPELSRNLYFTMYGYRTTPLPLVGTTTIEDSPVGIALGGLGTGSGQYWTSDADKDTILGGKRAQYLYWHFTRAAWVFSWSDYAEIQSSDIKEGRNIRCVRRVVNNS